MSLVFEQAAFTVRGGHEQAPLDQRPAMIAALRRAFPGLVSSWLTRREDGSWLDVILWRSREDDVLEQASASYTTTREAGSGSRRSAVPVSYPKIVQLGSKTIYRSIIRANKPLTYQVTR